MILLKSFLCNFVKELFNLRLFMLKKIAVFGYIIEHMYCLFNFVNPQKAGIGKVIANF